MRKKFSTLLLTGKAAALPLMMQQAYALTPTYTDVLSSQVSQIELPVANQVVLGSMGSSTYGGTATLCADTTLANEISLVITGLKDQDRLFVLTSTSLGGNERVDPRIRLGDQNLLIPISTGVSGPATGSITLTVPLKMRDLTNPPSPLPGGLSGYTLSRGSKFYMQTVVFPAGATSWAQTKISEVDTISVDNCSTYGGTTPYGGTTY